MLVRRGGRAVLCWAVPGEGGCRDGVALGTGGTGSGPGAPVAVARPVARPRIGRGATVTGGTAWTPWVVGSGRTAVFLGLQVRVDTAAAGFTATPCYFAQLTGALWHRAVPAALLVPFEHLTDQEREGFTVRLLMPWLDAIPLGASGAPDHKEVLRLLGPLDLAVTWIGVQSLSGGAQ